MIFASTNGISSEKIAKELKIYYKSACLLNTKCRILMRQCYSENRLDSKFYESDVAYIGSPLEGKSGLSTDKITSSVYIINRSEKSVSKVY